MMSDGSFDDLPSRKQVRLIGTIRALHSSLLDVVSEATLRHILAAAAVVVLGAAGCASGGKAEEDSITDSVEVVDTISDTVLPDTPVDSFSEPDADLDPDADVLPDTAVDTGLDTGLDTIADTGLDTGFDTGIDTGFDTGVDTRPDTGIDTGVDTGFDTGVDTRPDTVVDTITDPGVDGVTGITFDTVATSPFGVSPPSSYFVFPAVADIDGDGDLDLFLGLYSYYTTAGIYYYQNTGTASAPAFASPVTNPFGITVPGRYSAPRFADLDGDGDMDLITMAYDWSTTYFLAPYYYQNTGTATSPAFASPVANPFGTPDFGYWIGELDLVDTDGDGDLDLFVADTSGGSTGELRYLENTGSSTSPAFASIVSNPFGFTTRDWWAAPAWTDLDGDGDRDLMVGDGYGNFVYFQNTGTTTSPALGSAQMNPFSLTAVGMYYAFPAWADMDGDGDMDLFAGDDDGFLSYFANITP